MEKRRSSTYLVLIGLFLLFSQAAGRTNYGNSSQIAVTSKERRFEQNTTKNNTLGQNIPSNVGRRFVRNTAQGGKSSLVLPTGWEEKRDADGNTFYINHNTGTSHWDHPGKVEGEERVQEAESPGNCEEKVYLNQKYMGGTALANRIANSYGECKDICRNTQRCNYWSFVAYWNKEFKCVLKFDFSERTQDKGRTSGNICREITTEPSESPCDENTNCPYNEICRDGQCQDPCIEVSCDRTTGREVCLAKDHEATCVECTEDGHCRGDEQKCQGNQCEDVCTSNTCLGGSRNICIPRNHAAKCVKCVNHVDCDDDKICYSNNCYSICSANSCASNRYCFAENHNYECVRCIEDQHCRNDEKCENHKCNPVCTSETCSHYVSNKQCKVENRNAQCVRCIEDQHCGNDEKCQNHECNPVCTLGACSQETYNRYCKAENHQAQCVRCTQDNHCKGNYKCNPNNKCVECFDDDHCKDNEKCNLRSNPSYCYPVCTQNTCRSNGNKNVCIFNNHNFKCVECTDDTHCNQNEKCNGNNECVGCIQDEDCNDDERCRNKKCNPVCTTKTCMHMTYKKQCISKNRRPSCVKCSENHHCNTDEKCQDNDCVDVCDPFSCTGQSKSRCKVKDHAAKCVSCTRDVHCDEDKKCDDETNECIDACSETVCSAANTECIPKIHKPKCQCKSGYKLNGVICELITEWTNWVDEGICSKECDGGLQNQTRQCQDIWDNQLDETECPGQRSRELQCNTQLCGVTASSSSGDPSTIVDGNDSTHFSSYKENYPWVQLEYAEKRDVSGVRIKLHQNSDLTNLEVRIGDVPISEMMKPETVNAVCNSSKNFSASLLQPPFVDIVCNQLFTGNIITIQKKQNDTWLGIFKIEPMTTCPESYPFVSKDRTVCCSNLTNSENECPGGDQCPGDLCTHYIPVKDLHHDVGDLSGGIIKGVLSGVSTILILVLLVLFFLKRKSKHPPKVTKTNKKHAVTIVEIQPLTADHIIIKKPTNKKVKDKEFLKALKNTAKDSGALKREFRALEQLVAETIEVNKATTVGKLEENKTRNRYRDMVPYDNNIVYLEKPMGQPPSKYINASWITFPDDNQRYLAVQAPKVNMFSSFWQLVWEKKVGTIVMITDLEEGGKVKAHQYWPDKDNIVMDIDNGITLHYIKHEFPGTYYSRLIEVKYNNQKRMVNQIQTTAWLDLTAPKDSKILLDLVYKAQELLDENPGPVLVHCSAGVGRTGTFVGLYHLIKDYENDAVKEIDFYKTVLRMREQRMKMVQKHPQYHYIAKCLADYVSAQESEYG